MKRNGIRAILFVVPSLALFMGLVFTHPSIQIHADSSGSHHAVSVPQITCGQWNLIPNNSNNSVLEGVAAVSVNDAWAVGFTDVAGNINNRQPFTMHWDGNSWKSIASPTLAGTLNKLNGVAIIATNDVWAVGWFTLSGAKSIGMVPLGVLFPVQILWEITYFWEQLQLPQMMYGV